jgi:maltose alpha-D-glucosyltransferase/alpha-amylase
VATLQVRVPSEGNAWTRTRTQLGRYLERVLAQPDTVRPWPLAHGSWLHALSSAAGHPTSAAMPLVGPFLDEARLLGRRTAELHALLANADLSPELGIETSSAMDQRGTYQRARNLIGKTLRLLRSCQGQLHAATTPATAAQAEALVAAEPSFYRHLEPLLEARIAVPRIRLHGDLHLGRVLFTGKDFTFIGLDGDRRRPLAERRRKRPVLREVALMLRSFQAATFSTLHEESVVRQADRARAEPWALEWYHCVAIAYYQGYRDQPGVAALLPGNPAEVALLLDTYLHEVAFAELNHQLEEGAWARAAQSIEALLLRLEPASAAGAGGDSGAGNSAGVSGVVAG